MKKSTTIKLVVLFGLAFSVFYSGNVAAQTWFAGGSRPQDYEMGGDPTVSHESENAGFIRSIANKITGFGTWMTKIDAGEYPGKAIRLTAYVKTINVKNWVGLWMRVQDAGSQTLSFHNMQNRPITGTTDWQEYEIILEVPQNSASIYYGLLMDGTGEAWFDGLQVEPLASNWADQNSGITEFIYSIKAVNENTVWAGAGNGAYLKTTDGGLNWVSGKVPGAETMTFVSVAAIDQNIAYLLGQNFRASDGRIYKTSDGGTNWTLQYQNTSPGAFFNSIAFWDQNNGVAVGDPLDGSFLIVTTSDGGETWNRVPAENIPAPLPDEFGGMTGVGGTSLTVEGTRNAWFGGGFGTTSASPVRVFRSTDKGHHWTAANTPLSTAGNIHGIQTIVFKDSLNGFAGGINLDANFGPLFPKGGVTNTLVRTTDGGKNWEPVPSNWEPVPSFLPIYPSTLASVPQASRWFLFVSSHEGSGYSDDGGETWKMISNDSWYPMSFAGPNAGWAATSPAGRIARFVGQITTEIVIQPHENIPRDFELRQNYPNPFNPSTTISYSIPRAGFVELKIYNMLGREIQTLVNRFQQAGNYHFDFNAIGLSNGVYFYQLKVGNYVSETRKMLYLK